MDKEFIIFIKRTCYIQTRIFCIILKILSFDFPEKKKIWKENYCNVFPNVGWGSPPTSWKFAHPPVPGQILPVDSHPQQTQFSDYNPIKTSFLTVLIKGAHISDGIKHHWLRRLQKWLTSIKKKKLLNNFGRLFYFFIKTKV